MKKGSLATLSLTLALGLFPAISHADVGQSRNVPQMQADVWSALSGSTLRTTLEGWAGVSGWTLIWDSPYDYRIQASATFRDTFENSVGRLVDSIHQANPDINAILYRGNRVLHITSDALTSD
ncbi:toxin co-regulated pilus biosynthesis Q family protein [Pseudosulfitobacter pseudonitzschiae]|uniref:toxin co-regulated pilus biosynthesis Q family protein n=1 Tax=Pseudosulfitobacter pseudonitzschiae TaxID=1402135 RepID=UPI003B78909E